MNFFRKLKSSNKNEDGTYNNVYEQDIYENDNSDKIVATCEYDFKKMTEDGVILSSNNEDKNVIGQYKVIPNGMKDELTEREEYKL